MRLSRETVFPACSSTDLYRHLIIGVALVATCLVLIMSIMQNAAHDDRQEIEVIRLRSELASLRETAPPACKDLGPDAVVDYRGCTLLVDGTELRLIERVFVSPPWVDVTYDVGLHGPAWSPLKCYFAERAFGGGKVWEVPCDEPPTPRCHAGTADESSRTVSYGLSLLQLATP